jgi:hypothetical protein
MRNKAVTVGLSLLITGCVAFPTDTKITTSTYESYSLDQISKSGKIPAELRRAVNKKVRIRLKEDTCPCNRNKVVALVVSSIDQDGIAGFAEAANYSLGNPFYFDKTGDVSACQGQRDARNILDQARSLSHSRSYFYAPSYRLIWQAEQALDSPTCDAGKGTAIANQALTLAEKEGAKAIGVDISGTFNVSIISSEPEYFGTARKYSLKVRIEQNGDEFSGFDPDGEKVIDGWRIRASTQPTRFSVKFSSPDVMPNEIMGELRTFIEDVTYESGNPSGGPERLAPYGNLSMDGDWADTRTNASGVWELSSLNSRYQTTNFDIKGESIVSNWVRRQPLIKISYEDMIAFDLVSENPSGWVYCDPVGCLKFD